MELLARTCKLEEMNVQRILARAFVIFGGLFFLSMVVGAQWAYQGKPIGTVVGSAILWLVIIAAVFVLGMFYEVIAAIVLGVTALGVIVWGLVTGWDGGEWILMLLFLVLPLMVAAVLYYMAARMQNICTLKE